MFFKIIFEDFFLEFFFYLNFFRVSKFWLGKKKKASSKSVMEPNTWEKKKVPLGVNDGTHTDSFSFPY